MDSSIQSIFYERLSATYKSGEATEVTLTNAVSKGWLTEKQKTIIMSQPQEA